MKYSIKLTKIQCIKCYEFLVFATKINKNLSSKHAEKLLNHKKIGNRCILFCKRKGNLKSNKYNWGIYW